MTVHWPSIDHVLLDMDGTVLDLAFDNYFWGEVVPARPGPARAKPRRACRPRRAHAPTMGQGAETR